MHEIALKVFNDCLPKADHNSDENREEDGPTGALGNRAAKTSS